MNHATLKTVAQNARSFAEGPEHTRCYTCLETADTLDALLADQTWEAFCDTSYFDMWCVRKVGDRTFGSGFHLVNKEGAEQLRDYLNGISNA